MFGVGEMLLIVVAGAWIFGPQDLPRIARMVGNLTGRATGWVYRTRARLSQFAEETEITKLHQEMAATMYQLNAIRDELRGGINIMNPGPLTQRVLKIKPLAGPTHVDPWQDQQQQQWGGEPRGWAPPPGPQEQQQQSLEQQQYSPAWPGQQPPAAGVLARVQQALPVVGGVAGVAPSFAAAPLFRVAPQPAAAAAASGPAAFPASCPDQDEQYQQQQQQPGSGGGEEGEPLHPQQLPVSAVAAGLAPDRSKAMPAGSEVALDALLEEMVAHQALAFLQQHQGQALAAQQHPQAQAEQTEGRAAGAQQQGAQQQQPPPQQQPAGGA